MSKKVKFVVLWYCTNNKVVLQLNCRFVVNIILLNKK